MDQYIRSFYGYMHLKFGGNEALLSTLGGAGATIILFWAISGFFVFADCTGYPKWMRKYKIQLGRNEPPAPEKLTDLLKVVMLNNFVMNLGFAYPMYLGQKWAGCTFGIDETPTTSRLLIDLIAYILISEPVFYYTHRLLHHPALYKHVHKLHHRWTSPIAPVAIYTHPVEYLCGNIPTIYLGPLLMRTHALTIWVWYSVATIGTLIHHSGYHLPFLTSSEFHDYHHLTFNSNFGTLGIMDWLHGTDKPFSSIVEGKRHRTLLGTKSAREIFPDPFLQKRKVVVENSISL